MRIACNNLSFGYHPGETVFRGLSLALEPGTLTMLLGPNGCGKSTLLKLFSGMLAPCGGEVLLEGKPLRQWSDRERARHIAVVPQLSPVALDFTVAEMVMLGRNATLPRLAAPTGEDCAAMEAALRMLALERLRNRKFNQLSGGERQRVLAAAALARESAILLLDEPTSAMDPAHSIGLMKLLKGLARPPAILMAMHDLPLAAMFADRLILMKDGAVCADGAPEDVLTPERISEVYGCQAEVGRSPKGFLQLSLF